MNRKENYLLCFPFTSSFFFFGPAQRYKTKLCFGWSCYYPLQSMPLSQILSQPIKPSKILKCVANKVKFSHSRQIVCTDTSNVVRFSIVLFHLVFGRENDGTKIFRDQSLETRRTGKQCDVISMFFFQRERNFLQVFEVCSKQLFKGSYHPDTPTFLPAQKCQQTTILHRLLSRSSN